jgi:hypothetical protein
MNLFLIRRRTGLLLVVASIFLFIGVLLPVTDVQAAGDDPVICGGTPTDPLGLNCIRGVNLPQGTENNALESAVISLTNTALTYVGLIAVIMMIIAGFLYLTAAGSTSRIDDAKNIIQNSILGIGLILLSFVLTNFVYELIKGSIG